MSLYTQYVHAATSARWSSSNPALKPPVPPRPTTESYRPPRPANYPAKNANRPPVPTRPTQMLNPNLTSKHSSNNPVMRSVANFEDAEQLRRLNEKPKPAPRPQLNKSTSPSQTTTPVPRPRSRTNATSKESSNEPVMRPVVSSEDREYILRQNPTNKPVPKPRPTKPTPPARPTRPTKSPSKQNIEQQPDYYDTSNQALKDQWDNHPTIFKNNERIYFD